MDRAALDEAMEHRLPVGGWCPRGRRAEDGIIPDKYPLRETNSRSYAVRTDWNVRDADGTLVLVQDDISSGTQLTIKSAKYQGKPLQIVHLSPEKTDSLLTDENRAEENADLVADWIRRHRIRVLNVAGPRGSSSTQIYAEARGFLAQLFQRLSIGAGTPVKLADKADDMQDAMINVQPRRTQ